MQKKRLLLASFSHFMCDLNTGALPALLPFFVSIHGLSYSAVSALMLANTSLASVVQPLFGLLADRHCRMWYMSLGILVAGVGMGAVGFLDSYPLLFCAVGVSGLGTALFHPAAMRFATLASGSRQGTGTSFFSVGGNAGFLLAPICVVAIIEHSGLTGLGILAPLAILIALLLLFESRSLDRHQKEQEKKLRQDIHEMPRNDWKGFVRLLGAIFCRSVLMMCLRVFVPLYWIAFYAQTTAQAAMILTAFGLAGICGNLAGGVLADRFGYNRVIRISYFLVIPLIFLVPHVANVWLSNIIIVVLGFVLYASFSPVVVVGQRYLAKNLGFASGVTLGLGISFGGLVAPLLGYLADTQGLVCVFYALGACAVCGFLFTLLLLPVPKRQPV
ncbi:MAG: MFS transporter [Desulfovibrio sp.]|nr:MFS transporter [Desulfovibrio sp.]